MDQRIILGGEDLTDAINEELNNDLSQKIFDGNLSQKDIAKFNHDNPHNMIDGLGEVKLSVDADIFHALRIEMKAEMKDPSYECWDDPDFCNYVWKNYPEYRGSNSGKIVGAEGLLI